jgi:CBS domain-containing protein
MPSRMTTAREAMTGAVECIGENENIASVATMLADLEVGSLPICDQDNQLKGMVTARDIVVKVIAAGKDPAQVTVGSLVNGEPVTIGADETLQDALRTMSEHQVRRLPVIDGADVIGVLSEADVAKALPEEMAAELVEAVSSRQRAVDRTGGGSTVVMRFQPSDNSDDAQPPESASDALGSSTMSAAARGAGLQLISRLRRGRASLPHGV